MNNEVVLTNLDSNSLCNYVQIINIQREKTMVDLSRTYHQYPHMDQKKTLPALWGLSQKYFATSM